MNLFLFFKKKIEIHSRRWIKTSPQILKSPQTSEHRTNKKLPYDSEESLLKHYFYFEGFQIPYYVCMFTSVTHNVGAKIFLKL